jgi:tetratricopeptide (TPR) repeat protein
MSSYSKREDEQRRVVRVFVSSTFRDMQAERDELLKRVFPQLERLCRSRGVAWSEVDLRWGITDEQKAEGKVLPICLAEIQNCRPFFIGLLGERYGWIPDEVPQQVIEEEPWLAAFQNRSVTEIEIVHGVLNDPQMARNAFFYFRSPSYIDSLPSEDRPEYLESPTAEEIAQFGYEEAALRAGARRSKLESLKRRVRESGLPVREGYSNPRELGELVLRDLTAVIDRLYPEEAVPGVLEREAIEHEAFAAGLRRVFVERHGYLDRLDQHCEGSGPPLVVAGESGSGKSALLANWATGYRASHPDDYLMTHFVGAFPATTDWIAMALRITVTLTKDFGLPRDLPKDISEMTLGDFRDGFAAALDMASRHKRVVLILDGLDHINDYFGGLDLFWLPDVFPPGVRLIVSSGPGRPFDALESRGWPTLEIEPLELPERRRFIEDYLTQFKKALGSTRVERIAKARQTSNPLYLQTLLAELRLHGDHHTLDDRIGFYLEARKVDKLYEKILGRYDQDYDRERENLVQDAMSLLWAARFGLYERELLSLLGSDGEPLPQGYWSPLLLAAGQSLMSRGGLLTFAHDYVRQAVERRYLHTQSKRRAAHLRLVDYQQSLDESEQNKEELAWQLFKARAWKQLASLLSDLTITSRIWFVNKYDARMYWSHLESNSPFRMKDVYKPVLDDPARYAGHAEMVASLLTDVGHTQEAAVLEERLADHYRQAGDQQSLANSLLYQAVTLSECGQSDQAMALLKQHERLCRELNDQTGLALNRSLVLMEQGELDSALLLLKEEEVTWRKMGDERAVALCLGVQADILKQKGQLREALAHYKEQERISLKYGLRDQVSESRVEQAKIMKSLGDFDGAMTRLKKEERLTQESEDDLALAGSLASQADVFMAQGEFEKAMRLYQQQERLCRKGDNLAGVAYSLRNQAVMLQIQGDFDNAMRLHKEHERIARETGDEAELARGLGNQALILKELGDLSGAMALHKEEEGISRRLGDRRTLAHSLGNQAMIFFQQGELDRAISLREEEEAICRELGDPSELARCLINKALVLAGGKGRAREALPLAEEAYDLASGHNLGALMDQIRPAVEFVRSKMHTAPEVRVDIPTPHPGANADRAAQLNIEYYRELSRWKALPLWKRLRTKRPLPPKGI